MNETKIRDFTSSFLLGVITTYMPFVSYAAINKNEKSVEWVIGLMSSCCNDFNNDHWPGLGSTYVSSSAYDIFPQCTIIVGLYSFVVGQPEETFISFHHCSDSLLMATPSSSVHPLHMVLNAFIALF